MCTCNYEEAASYLPFFFVCEITKHQSYNLPLFKTHFPMPVSKFWLYIVLMHSCYRGKLMGRLRLTHIGKETLPALHPAEEKLSV